MKQIFLITCAAVLLLSCGGCEMAGGEDGASNEGKGGTISIMTWNLQALFDGEENGAEYEEYLDSAGWSGEKYSARLNAIAQGIDHLEQGSPDILALEEVENARVLEDLAQGALAKYGYRWSFFANNPGASLGIGVLSRFPLSRTRAHSFSNSAETTPRPVMEVWVEPQGRPLALFICHWKSKLGGDEATESLRRASARVILRRLRETDLQGVPALIMGDLNENHDEFYRQAGAFLGALIPDDPQAADLAGFYDDSDEAAQRALVQKKQADFLILSRKKPPVSSYFGPGATVLYSPWESELQDGSYYYKNAWETIDHFLLSESLFDKKDWDFEDCTVVNVQPFTNSRGFPNAYNPRTGAGLSDHLPLLLTLKVQEP
ncbi:endonuclease [Spirochaetia bacterium]|nr:endonuclease [Spirochaetia bacterium]